MGVYGYSFYQKLQVEAKLLKGSYAAAGGTLGTFSGALIDLAFMFYVVWINKEVFKKRAEKR